MPSWLLTVLRFFVSGGIIGLLFFRLDLTGVAARLGDADGGWIALALTLFMVQAGLAAVRWRRVNCFMKIDLSTAWHVRHVLVGLFFGQALPTNVGGDVVRTWQLSRRCGSVTTAVHSVIVDRAIGMATLLLLAGLTVPLLVSRSIAPDAVMTGLLVVGGGVAATGALLLFGGLSGKMAQLRVVRLLAGPFDVLRRIIFDLREAGLQVCIGIAIHLGSVFAFVMLAFALHVPLSPLSAVAVLPLVLLIAGLPVSIAGWGIREGGMVAGFALLGLPGPEALILSIAFGLGELGVGLVGGVVSLVGGSDRFVGAPASLRDGSTLPGLPP